MGIVEEKGRYILTLSLKSRVANMHWRHFALYKVRSLIRQHHHSPFALMELSQHKRCHCFMRAAICPSRSTQPHQFVIYLHYC
jgi:hypothetical protein